MSTRPRVRTPSCLLAPQRLKSLHNEKARNIRRRVENGHVTLPPDADIPDKTLVYVLVPNPDMDRTYKIMSQRFADPGQAKDFKLEVIEESHDGGI